MIRNRPRMLQFPPYRIYRNTDDPYSRALIVELHRAAREDNAESVEDILLTRVPVSSKREVDDNATIHFATRNVHFDLEVISLLIKKGADVNHVNRCGKTPLHLALERDNTNTEVIKLLLESGADVNRVNVSNSCALHFAVQGTNCKVEVLDLLLERGAVLHATNLIGDTAFLRALRNPYCTKEMLAWFLQHGANIAETNRYARSVLHTIAENPNFNLDVLKFLLKNNGIPLNLVNSSSKTPLYIAIENSCNPSITLALLDAGAMIDGGQSTFKVAMDVCSNTWSKNSMENLALLVRFATLRNLGSDIENYLRRTDEPRFRSLLDFMKLCRKDVKKMFVREILPGASFRDFLTGQIRLKFNALEPEGELCDLNRIFHIMEVDRYNTYTSIISWKLNYEDNCNYLRLYAKSSTPESRTIFLDFYSVARIVGDLSKQDVFNSMIAFHTAEVCDECRVAN